MGIVIGILVLLFLSFLLAARLYTRHKAKLASPSRLTLGTKKRTSASSQNKPSPSLHPGRAKALGLGIIGFLLLAWLAVSLLGSPKEPPQDMAATAQAATQVEAQEPAYAPELSVKIDPPPAQILNPLIFEIPPLPPEGETQTEGATPLDSSTASALPVPDDSSQTEASTTGTSFNPEEQGDPFVLHPMSANARDFSPIISRMEPLGRSLDPENPVPRAQPLPPPSDEPPAPKRPRLTAPPPQPPELPMVSSQPTNQRRYTIIVGSFSKSENAEKLKKKLEDEGLPAEVVSVTLDNQPWWRVMSGVFDDKESAEAYSRELQQKNLVERPYVKIL
ncbi:MAG: SPOR domain-containing protein [Deltaproteobacteria bacterium]|nr:SPOR domain-containing protein [Deltaproteobacteria bacterium]